MTFQEMQKKHEIVSERLDLLVDDRIHTSADTYVYIQLWSPILNQLYWRIYGDIREKYRPKLLGLPLRTGEPFIISYKTESYKIN